MNWVNKAGSLCIREIQTWRRRGAGFGHYTLGQLSRSSRFLKPNPFIPCMDVEPLCSLLYLFLSSCVLVRGSYGVHLENSLGVTQPFTLFSLSFALISSTEVRSEERGMLERAGVVQSLTVGVAPIVVVISSVCTFTLHMALGYDLTAAEVFKYGNLYSPCSLSMFPLWIHLPSLETCLLYVCASHHSVIWLVPSHYEHVWIL